MLFVFKVFFYVDNACFVNPVRHTLPAEGCGYNFFVLFGLFLRRLL